MSTKCDNCGSCGEDLEIFNTCMVCEKPSMLRCIGCFDFVEDPIHTECMILDDSI